jgi:hypothetical protein
MRVGPSLPPPVLARGISKTRLLRGGITIPSVSPASSVSRPTAASRQRAIATTLVAPPVKLMNNNKATIVPHCGPGAAAPRKTPLANQENRIPTPGSINKLGNRNGPLASRPRTGAFTAGPGTAPNNPRLNLRR